MVTVRHIIHPFLASQVAVYYDISGIPVTGASNAASTLSTSSTLAAFLQRLKQSGRSSCTMKQSLHSALLHSWHVSPRSMCLHPLSSGHQLLLG
jgi:hypothetical protein